MIKQSATLNFNNKQFNIYGDQGDSSVFTMLSRDGVYEPSSRRRSLLERMQQKILRLFSFK